MRRFTFFFKAIFIFAGIILLSAKNASADCPTNTNTIFTTENETCFGANDGIINIQFNDGEPIIGVSVLFEPNRLEVLLPGLDFTVTKIDDFNYRLSNVEPGSYFVRVVCSDGNSINLGDPVNPTNPNPRIVAAPSVLPTALPASNIACQSFTANWTDVAAAEGFLVEVALDDAFTNLLPGFDNLDVGKTTSLNVPGLIEGTTYYYRVKGYRESCPPQISATITATTPPAPVIFDITSPDSDICEDGSFNVLLNSSETGVNYEVFIDGSPSGIVVAGTGAALPVGPVAGLAPNATYVLTIVATTGENCTREMNGSVNLLVNPLPVVSINDPGGPFCANEGDVTLTGLPAGGTWSGDGVDTNSGVFSPSTLLPGDYAITYTYTDANGCENSDQVIITINPVPDATITAAGPFCEDADAVTLTAATAGGGWSGPGITDAAAGTFDPSSAGVGTHIIEYTVTNAEGCTETGTIEIIVNPLPDATITAAGPFCRNDVAVTLTAATPGGTWSGPGITDASAGTFDPATAGAGTHTITYTLTSGDGCTASDEIQILVNELPDVSIDAAGPFCLDAVPVNLNAATPGGAWSGPGITDATNGTFSASTAGIGTHIIEYTVTNAEGCTDTGQLEIIVNELPDASITAVGPFCLNDDAVTLTAATAGGTWSGPGITNAAAGTFDPSVAGVGIHEITYNLLSPEGCEDSDQIFITVNDIPDATITAAGPYCVDEASVNLTAATPGGSWSGDGITNAALGTFDPAVAGPGIHTITYTVSNAEGCENIGTIDIVVNDLPDATITAAGPFCVDADAVSLTAATAGGSWSGPGITDAAAGTFDPSVAGVGTHTIEYTVTNAEGCSDTGSIEITVNPLPDATITVAGPFCEDDAAVTLTAATPGGTWSGPGITDAAAGTFDPATAGSGTHSITYTLTSGDGCIASNEIQIVVNELPDVSIDAAGPFCLDAVAVNLNAATPGGTWSGPGITDAAAGTFDPSVAGVGTHIIEYTVTNAEGCTDTGQLEIIVNPLPDASITAAGPFCLNDDAVTLTAATAGGTWSGPGITDAAAGTFDPSVAGVGIHEIIFTVSNGDGCESTDQISITVNDIPDATITAVGPFCVDEAAVNLTAATPGGSWSGDGITNAALGTFDPAVAGPGTHTITYTVSNAEGCENIGTIDIVVNDLPDATITAAGPFCVDADAVSLTAATAGGNWSGPGITDAAAGTFDPSVAGVGTHTIEYTVTNAEGCSDTGSIEITVNPLPDATITAAGPFCEDDAAITLSAATAGGTWSGPGITDANAGTFDPSMAGAGIHTISYTVSNGGGCEAIGTIEIIVNELPDATITAAGPFCANEALVTLTAATPGGIWSGPGITDAATGTFDPSVAGIGTHTIIYTVTNAEGCEAVGQIEIIVNPSPDASINPVAPVCSTVAPFNLSAATAGGAWSGPGITDAGSGLFDPALAGVGDHIIRYEITVGGCESIDEINITVLPVAEVVITPAGPFCENDGAFTLSASEAGGIWSGPGIIDAGTGLFDPQVAGIGEHIIQYIFTNPNGCESVAQISLVVDEVPEVTITPVAPLCGSDASINLQVNLPGGVWSGPGITDNVNGVFNPLVAGTGIHTIIYELTSANGCTASAEIQIEVRENPDVEVQAAGPFCLDTAPVNLVVNLPGGTWSGPGITDASNGVFDPSTAGAGVHRIIYTLEIDGCTGADSIDIVVNDVPTLLITQPEAICQPGVVDLTNPQVTSGSSAGILSYWTDAAATVALTNPSTVTDAGTYYIKLSSAEGCEAIAPVAVNILTQPVTSAISGETNPLCEAEGIVYSVNPAPTSNFQWSFQGLDGSSVAAGQGTSAIAVNFGNVNGLLQVVQTAANGCVAETVSIPISLQGCALNANFIASPESVCIGEEIVFSDLSGGDPVSWEWEFGEGASPATFTGQTPPAVVYATSGSKTVRLVVSDGSLSSEFTREINVKVSPVAIISGISGVCPGDETELTIEISGTPGPYNVVYTDGTDNFTLNNISSPHAVTVSPEVTTTYTLVSVQDLSVANGCSATDIGPGVVIEILTPPDAPQNPVDNVFCAGDEPTAISVDDPGAGFTVRWFDAPVDGNLLASGQASFTPGAAGIYYAEITDPNGCTSTSRTAVELTELDPPVAGAITGNATPDCGETNVVFSVEPRAGSTYVWTVPNEAVIVSGQGTHEITVDFGNRNGLVSVQETDENGCAGEIVSLTVSLQNCPLIPDIELSANSVCLGSTITVTSNSVGVIQGTTEYLWDFGPDAIFDPADVNAEGPFEVSFSSAGAKTIRLSLSNDGINFEGPVEVPVQVFALPTATMTGDNEICFGSSTPIRVQVTGQTPWRLEYTDGNDVFTVFLSNPAPVFNVSPSTSRTYELVSIRDANQCFGTLSGSATIQVNASSLVTLEVGQAQVDENNVAIVPVSVSGFENYAGMQFTVAWDPDQLAFQSTGNFGITGLSEAANLGTNNAGSGFITFSWNSSNASDTTIADGTLLFEMEFNLLTSGCTISEVRIDASGSAPVVAEVYSEFPCTRVPAIINGSVTDLPEPPTFAVNPVEICRDDDLPVLTAIGENIRWYADREKINMVFTGNEFTPDNSLVNNALPGTYWLYASQTPGACPQESALDSVAVVVLPGPENVVFSASETSVCPDSEITFTVEPAGLANYTFIRNGTEVQSGNSPVYSAAQWNDGDQVFAVVRDAQGCTFTTDAVEIDVLELEVSFLVTEISVCGAADGVLSAEVSGGSGDYTFTWTGPGISNPSLELQTGLMAGAYNVSVVDNVSGCTGFAEILLENPVPFTINLVSRQDASSFGGSDGAISIEIVPAGVYTIQWTGPSNFTASTTSIDNLTAGRYIANVSDGLCVDSLIVFINQPIPGIIISSIKTDVSTCGATDGAIDLTVTGGSGSFSYLWQGPNSFTATQPDLGNLAAGLYFVTVTDLETGLVQQHVVQINAPTDFVVDAQINNVSACAGAEDGSITLNVSGGQGPFTFTWSSMLDPEFSATGNQIDNLAVGEYGVTITDTGTGCSRSLALNVALPAICDQPCTFMAAVASNPTTCPDSTRGNSIIFIINGGSGPGNYEYSMDDGETFEPFNGESVANIASLGQGSYVIIVRDRVTSCTSTVVANVGVSSSLAAVVNRSNPGCQNDDGAITFDVFGISPFIVTLIDAEGNETVKNGNRFFEFDALQAGAYYYNVSESGQFGCVIEAGDSVRLSVDCPGFICDELTVEVRDAQDATCFDEPNGSAIFDVTGGNNPYQYSLDGENWITFISGNRVNTLPPNGEYNILIRQSEEFNFCNATVSVEINGPDAIVMNPPVVLVSNADCNVNNGIVRIGEISGGTGPYTYELDGIGIELPAEGLLENLRAGQRVLTVTDALGCVKDFTFNVPSPGSVVATVAPIPVSCTSIQLKAGIEIQVDLVNTLVSGPYQAQIIALDGFNPTDTTIAIPDIGRRTLLGLDKGNYQVIVRSATGEGCSFEEFISLDEGPSPVDFDIVNQDQVVSCAGEPGSIVLNNIRGDINEMFIIQLLDLQGNVLETFERRYAEIENQFVIDGRITNELFSGQYQVRMIQNQTDCQGIAKTSGVIFIREPLGELGFEIIDDALSFVDRPTGRIRGEINSSGGDPFFALIQLKEPAQRLNVNDVIDFNNNQQWRQVVNSAANATRFLVTFDSLWAGLYEIFIRDEYGCEIVIEYYLAYDERVFIPNVITPNNDGINDTFFIRNMPPEGTEVIITNRWGKVVFSTKSYSEDALWDGGNESDGIFYYKVKVPTGEVYTGWLEVWRGARP